ncbi:Hypothetical Protein FCC1311_102502 [Hondaea fermentalgiana]|uniref:EF-hand domain-containing protein n=1 Tax=Hondaea fermentalgiana TaxID=2315210 RepID=A0A2R5GT30_9STRA|nr:Hypothetical Protein FCC1311_102502 [Hondaea fermentalgiana]|eukprot:GBG34027.1 Hypothetical Protein FCC1311_102502 [Hondaea fermentalgiana]
MCMFNLQPGGRRGEEDAFVEGERVLAHFRGNPEAKTYPGVVKRVHDNGRLDVAYDDGDFDKELRPQLVQRENQRRSASRRPSVDTSSPSKQGTKGKVQKKMNNDVLATGDRVLCRFRGKGDEYPGTIARIHPRTGRIDVNYDDGDKDVNLDMSAARPLDKKGPTKRAPGPGATSGPSDASESGSQSEDDDEDEEEEDEEEDELPASPPHFKVDMPVMARFRGKHDSKEFPGKIARVHRNGTLDIHYDDGDVDRQLDPKFVRRKQRVVETGRKDDDAKCCKLVEMLARAIASGGSLAPGAAVLVSQSALATKGRRRTQPGVISALGALRGTFDVTLDESGSTLRDVPARDLEPDEARALTLARLRTVLKNACQDTAANALSRVGLSAALRDALNMIVTKRDAAAAVAMFPSRKPSSGSDSADSLDVRQFLAAVKSTVASFQDAKTRNEAEEPEVAADLAPASVALRQALSACILQAGAKAAKKLVGNHFSLDDFRAALDNLGGRKSLSAADGLAWIHAGLDVRGDGMVAGDHIFYYASCMNVHVPQTASAALNRARAHMHGKEGLSKVLRGLLKDFEKVEGAVTDRQVDSKTARTLLQSAGVDKKDIEAILKIDFATARESLAKSKRSNKKDGEGDGSSSDSSSDSDGGDARSTQKRQATSRKLSINQWRFKRNGPNKFSFDVFIGAMASPPLDEARVRLCVQPLFLTSNAKEWLAKLGKKKVLSESTLFQQLVDRYGLTVTPELLTHCAQLGGALSGKSQEEVAVDTGKLKKWLVKARMVDAGGRAEALGHLRKHLGSTRNQIIAFFNASHGEEDERKDDESDSGRGVISRKAFWALLEEKKAKCARKTLLVRAALEHLDAKRTGEIDVHGAAKLIVDANEIDGKGKRNSGSESESGESSGSEDDSNASDKSSVDAESDSDADSNASKSSGLVTFFGAKQRKEFLKALEKRLPKGGKDPAKALRKALRAASSKSQGSDSEDSGSDGENEHTQRSPRKVRNSSKPSGLASFLGKDIGLDVETAQMLCVLVGSHGPISRDQKAITRLVHLTQSLRGPGVPKAESPAALAIDKLRRAANAQTQAALASQHHGLLDVDKSLKARVKSVLQAKAPKLATREHIAELLDGADEAALVRDLGKKYRIKVPASARLELSKLDTARSGKIDGKKAIASVAKALGAKVDKVQSEAICKHFAAAGAEEGAVDAAALAAALQPETSRVDITFALRHLMEAIDLFAEGSSLIDLEAVFARAMYAMGANLTPSEVYALATMLATKKAGDGMVSLAALRKLEKEAQDVKARDEDASSASSQSEGEENSSASDSSDEDGDKDKGTSDASESEQESDEDNKSTTQRSVKGSRWFTNFRKSQGAPKPSRNDDGVSSDSDSAGAELDTASDEDDSESDGEKSETSLAPRNKAIISSSLRSKLASLDTKRKKALVGQLRKASRGGKGFIPRKTWTAALLKTAQLSKKEINALVSVLGYGDQSAAHVDDLVFLLFKPLSKSSRRVLDKIQAQLRDLSKKKQAALLQSFRKMKGVSKSSALKKSLEAHKLKAGNEKALEQICAYMSQQSSPGAYLADMMSASCDTKRLEKKLRRGLKGHASKGKKKLDREEFYTFMDRTGVPLGEHELRCLSLASQVDEEEEEEDDAQISLKLVSEFARGRGRLGMNTENENDDSEGSGTEDSDASVSSNAGEEDDLSEEDGSSADEDSEDDDDDEMSVSSEEDEVDEEASLSGEDSVDESASDDLASVGSSSSESGSWSGSRRRKDRRRRRSSLTRDGDGSSSVDQRDLGRAMLALGHECSGRSIAREAGHSKEDDKFSRREFVKIGLRLMRASAHKLGAVRSTQLREVLGRADRAGTGTISSREFAESMQVACKGELSREEIKLLVRFADSDRDGQLNIAAFLGTLQRGGPWPRADKRTRAALYKVIRGPVPDPMAYLKTFGRTPSNYRPPVTQELNKSQEHTAESALVEPLAHDSRITEAQAQAQAHISDGTQTLQIQLRVARGIPVIADDKLAQRVLERRARICLWRKPASIILGEDGAYGRHASNSHTGSDDDERSFLGSGEEIDDEENGNGGDDDDDDVQALRRELQRPANTHLRYAGNSYIAPAGWDRAQEDVWQFSSARGADDVLVRIPEGLRELCRVRGESLVLLVELSLLVETGADDRAPPVEMSCGWSGVELEALDRASHEGREVRAALLSPTARRTRRAAKPSADHFFSAIPAPGAKGRDAEASTLLFRPFDIREATL